MDYLKKDFPYDHDTLDLILHLIVEVMCSRRKQIRIASDDKPIEIVRSTFMKLDSEHIRFVMDSFKENRTDVRNIKQYLLASIYNIELSGMEVSLVNTMSREKVLKQYLDTVKSNYDFILLDCMPSLGMLTVNALAAADNVLIPVQAAYLPAKGLEQLLQTINKARRNINPKLKIERRSFLSQNTLAGRPESGSSVGGSILPKKK